MGVSFDGKTATSKRVGWTAGISSQCHIMEDDGANVKAMVVSSGMPFGDAVGPNSSHMITQGGVYAISPTKCIKLWPNMVDNPEFIASGAVVNRIVCHRPTGICFFS